MTSTEPKALEAKLKAAHAAICKLAESGGRDFRMSIPAREDDTDLVVAGALFEALAYVRASQTNPVAVTEAERHHSDAQLAAIEAVVRQELCPVENSESQGDDEPEPRYICMNEDGDRIIEADDIPGVIRQVIARWDAAGKRCEAAEASLEVLKSGPALKGKQEPVWSAIRSEVEKATAKFPTWPTDPLHALAILGEEFGELTKAVVQQTYEPHKNAPGEVRTEAIHAAAMALRFAMSLDVYEVQPSAQHSQGHPLTVETLSTAEATIQQQAESYQRVIEAEYAKREALEATVATLRDERDDAQQKLADLAAGGNTAAKCVIAGMEELIAACEARNAAQTELARLRVALTQHGQHPASCPKGVGVGWYKPRADAVCDCGIDAALTPSHQEPSHG